MVRVTTLVFKNHQQNSSFRSHQILKKKIPITSSFILFLALDSFYFVLFVSSIMGGRLIQELSKILFLLEKRGRLIHESTYTRENT